MSEVGARLERVRDAIASACRATGRSPDHVRLVAVSKRKPASAVRDAYDAGQRDFGENYVQELVEKADALADLAGLRWHFIGHLQSNKAKLLATRRDVASATVASARVAAAIAKRRSPTDPPLELLLEVNVSGEASKSGCAPDDAAAEVAAIRALPSSVALIGLMTVPPEGADPRPSFAALRRLAETVGVRELSMGMTGDLEAAIAEGATIVRVGTAIFGARD